MQFREIFRFSQKQNTISQQKWYFGRFFNFQSDFFSVNNVMVSFNF